MKYIENLSGGSRVIPCGQMDDRHEASSRFLQFCKHTKMSSQ